MKFDKILPTYEMCRKVAEEQPEFREFDRGDFIVFDYMISDGDTFKGQTQLNMRGIAFCSKTKRVVSAPFHKFFNLGERADTQPYAIDLNEPHVVLEKLDGSLIRTIAMPNGQYRLGTRAGITDISMMAEEFVAARPAYDRFIRDKMSYGWTLMFEFCSRKNRVVIDHPEDRLVLIGARDVITGYYKPYSDLIKARDLYGIEVVQAKAYHTDDISKIHETIKELQGEEGVVIRFYTGAMLKIKADDYVLKHSALDGLRSDRRVLEMVMDSAYDDILPLLDEDMSDRLVRYSGHVNSILKALKKAIEISAEDVRRERHTRKEQAQAIFSCDRLKPYAPFIFQILDGKELNLVEHLKNAGRKNMIEDAKKFGICAWSDFE